MIRFVAVLLAVVALGGCLRFRENQARAAVPDYPNTHVNTGNQRQDILAVALTQMGYTEGPNNDTKYGAWGNFPNQPWCANFISWCARQAEISQEILTQSPVASPKRFGIEHFDGAKYTPRPGDLFFTKELSHVGLVYYLEGEYFYTIEGNVNIDENEDGYFVMTLKRRISDYYFGVPAYEGEGDDHEYVRRTESAHPHKSYYECVACGDRHDTGYEDIDPECGRCLSCGCSSKYAGYYYASQEKGTFYVWQNHDFDGPHVGCILKDTVVYVHGIDYGSGWACIEYDGLRGHYLLRNLKKYYPAPQAPRLHVDQTTCLWGDTVKLSWDKPANTEEFRLRILRDGEVAADELLGTAQSYTLNTEIPGHYEISIIAANRTGWSEPGTAGVWVRSTCTVAYDPGEGTGAPGSVTHVSGDPLKISEMVPTRPGYDFLGWTEEAGSSLARYAPGETIDCETDLTLHAVWKASDAVAHSLAIEEMPNKTLYVLGDSLDTAGLVLKITYTDGTGALVRRGFTVEGFASDAQGEYPITVTCQGLTVGYNVRVVSYLPGDIDLNGKVDRDDVMRLLWHITFPEQFPIAVPGDFTGDAQVNRDDVMRLLWHITFPDMFPLENG
jgi:uncharacterized repeat protein (TIGR02543 family)